MHVDIWIQKDICSALPTVRTGTISA